MPEYTLKELFGPDGMNPSLEAVAAKMQKPVEEVRQLITGERHALPSHLNAIERAIHSIAADMLEIMVVTEEYKLGFEGLIKRAVNTPPMANEKKKKK